MTNLKEKKIELLEELLKDIKIKCSSEIKERDIEISKVHASDSSRYKWEEESELFDTILLEISYLEQDMENELKNYELKTEDDLFNFDDERYKTIDKIEKYILSYLIHIQTKDNNYKKLLEDFKTKQYLGTNSSLNEYTIRHGWSYTIDDLGIYIHYTEIDNQHYCGEPDEYISHTLHIPMEFIKLYENKNSDFSSIIEANKEAEYRIKTLETKQNYSKNKLNTLEKELMKINNSIREFKHYYKDFSGVEAPFDLLSSKEIDKDNIKKEFNKENIIFLELTEQLKIEKKEVL